MLHGLEQGPVVRVNGPYAISGRWWEHAVQHDYHFAETRDGHILWAYYDRASGGGSCREGWSERPMPPYVPLWTKSCFSFLEGASHPEEYVETALAHGIEAIALTDRDGVYGAVEMHLAGRERGVKILHGSEITVDDGSTIVLLAASRAGWARLCTLVTAGRRRSEKGTSKVGDKVVIRETSPISKTNRFRLVRVLTPAKA